MGGGGYGGVGYTDMITGFGGGVGYAELNMGFGGEGYGGVGYTDLITGFGGGSDGSVGSAELITGGFVWCRLWRRWLS